MKGLIGRIYTYKQEEFGANNKVNMNPITRVYYSGMTGNSRKMVPVSRHWMECTEPDNITKFYYNISTGESSWIEPEEVRRTVKSLEQLGELVEREEGKRQVLRTVDKGAWQERVDQQGKTYFYNTVTKASVWEMPVELREWKESMVQPGFNREQAETDFVKMLEERGVGVAWQWEDVLKEIINHPMYKSLPTLADRKACFLKYQEHLRLKKTREGKRSDPRDDFMDALMSLKLNRNSRFHDIEDKLKRLDCYTRLSPRERLDLFETFIKTLHKQYRQAVEEELADYLYSSRFEFAKVGWSTVKADLVKRFPNYSLADLLMAWQRYILDCEERTIQQAHKERQELLSKRLETCLLFRRLLEEIRVKRRTNFDNISFNDVLPEFSFDPVYKTLQRIDPHLPVIIYLNYKDELEAELEKDREFIADLKRRQVSVDVYVQSCCALDRINVDLILGTDWCKIVSSTSANTCQSKNTSTSVSESISEAKVAEGTNKENISVNVIQQTDKDRFRPVIDQYKHLLKHFNPPVHLHSLYRDFEPLLKGHPAHDTLPPAIRQEYFVKYQLYLKRKQDDLVDRPPKVSRGQNHE